MLLRLIAALCLALALPRTAGADPAADAALKAMIGQMILIGFEGRSPEDAGVRRVVGLLRAGEIGGVVLFAGNVESPRQLRRLTSALSRAGAAYPPFIAVDQEGGRVQRLTPAKGFAGLPSADSVARLGPAAAYRLYAEAARELAALGINVNFGPVVDLALAPAGPAIGRLGRSFGTRPSTVAALAYEFLRAHAQAGVLTSLKHFPGHGSARGDSHKGAVDVTATWKESELSPFRELGSHADMVMVGHLIHPRFSDAGPLPASLSKRAIQGVLRGELGFSGLVVVDDLDMGAVSGAYSLERAAVLAVGAGADLLIVGQQLRRSPRVPERIAGAIEAAVAAGEIDRRAIEASYRRVLRAKAKLKRSP